MQVGEDGGFGARARPEPRKPALVGAVPEPCPLPDPRGRCSLGCSVPLVRASSEAAGGQV